jgi:hypothetical protein
MYLPSERMVVNGVGLGAVDGFNIGKAFNRMFTFKPSSFKFSNIMGALGSAAAFTSTFGLSSALAPKTFGAHSTAMKALGTGVTVAAAAYGGAQLLPAGTLSSIGGVVKSAGTTLLNNAGTILKTGMQLFGGGGSQQAVSQAEAQAMQQQQELAQQQAYMLGQQQAAQQAQALETQYGPGMDVSQQLTPTTYPTMPSSAMSGGYGPYSQDTALQSPYSMLADDQAQQAVDPKTGLITDPTTGNKIDPGTGQIVQAGMLPQLSTTTWVVIGGATLLGLYLMSDSKNN